MNDGGRQLISSGGPWEAKVGYSRAVRVGSMVFVSGSTAMKDGIVVGKGDVAAQTRQTLATISEALTQAGATPADVVRLRVFVRRISDWPAVGEELGRVFGNVRPASTMVEVSALIDPDMLVEIEADAIIGSATSM